MSGGSFNYLCYVQDLSDLMDHRYGNLKDMQASLAKLEESKKEAEDTQEIIDLIEEFDLKMQEKVESLRGVWKATEWWFSGDSGKEEFLAAIEKRKERHEALADSQKEVPPTEA